MLMMSANCLLVFRCGVKPSSRPSVIMMLRIHCPQVAIRITRASAHCGARMHRVRVPQYASLTGGPVSCTGLPCMDSLARAVCHPRRSVRPRVCAGIAPRGQTSMERRVAGLGSHSSTAGDNRKPVPGRTGKLWIQHLGDQGSIAPTRCPAWYARDLPRSPRRSVGVKQMGAHTDPQLSLSPRCQVQKPRVLSSNLKRRAGWDQALPPVHLGGRSHGDQVNQSQRARSSPLLKNAQHRYSQGQYHHCHQRWHEAKDQGQHEAALQFGGCLCELHLIALAQVAHHALQVVGYAHTLQVRSVNLQG